MRVTDGHNVTSATVLRCANCCDHQETTRHNEDRYRGEAQKVRVFLESALGPDVDITEEAPTNPPRMGAFEVTLNRDGFRPIVLFSKLRTGRFPLDGELRRGLDSVLSVQGVQQELPKTIQSSTVQRAPRVRPSTAPSSRKSSQAPQTGAKTTRSPPVSVATKSRPKAASRPNKRETNGLTRANTESALIPPTRARKSSVTPVPMAEIIYAAANRRGLRELFVKTALSYCGVPYTKPTGKNAPGSPWPDGFHLDCCALVRQCVKDLRKEFGFTLGGWNQGYQFDTLPIALETVEEMEPGDLVFISGIYNVPHKKQHAHDMVHVEIFLGGETGEQTVGARYRHGVVEVHDSYRFESKNYHSMKYYFRSLQPWLAGICQSWCSEHRWRYG
mmetsp:Transcript_12899/g.29639  ORF Transcript_12899/g.29639 Transcript_12899/m.29639 type:complete len:388 (+) Transcript_12899:102-1265(+)